MFRRRDNARIWPVLVAGVRSGRRVVDVGMFSLGDAVLGCEGNEPTPVPLPQAAHARSGTITLACVGVAASERRINGCRIPQADSTLPRPYQEAGTRVCRERVFRGVDDVHGDQWRVVGMAVADSGKA